MEAQQRLQVYKKALLDYRKAYYFGWLFLDKRFNTSRGFCFYFIEKKVQLFDLTELDILRPEESYYEFTPNGCMPTTYWFAPGDRLSRIELLKRTIKLIKNQSHDYN